MADTDDPEAPCNAVYNHNMYCGGSECVNKGGDAVLDGHERMVDIADTRE